MIQHLDPLGHISKMELHSPIQNICQLEMANLNLKKSKKIKDKRTIHSDLLNRRKTQSLVHLFLFLKWVFLDLLDDGKNVCKTYLVDFLYETTKFSNLSSLHKIN
jgi:hypothetical protein